VCPTWLLLRSLQTKRLSRVHRKTLARTWQQTWQCLHLAHVRLERLYQRQSQRLERLMTLRLWGYCLACVGQGVTQTMDAKSEGGTKP